MRSIQGDQRGGGQYNRSNRGGGRIGRGGRFRGRRGNYGGRGSNGHNHRERGDERERVAYTDANTGRSRSRTPGDRSRSRNRSRSRSLGRRNRDPNDEWYQSPYYRKIFAKVGLTGDDIGSILRQTSSHFKEAKQLLQLISFNKAKGILPLPFPPSISKTLFSLHLGTRASPRRGFSANKSDVNTPRGGRKN